jgi:hypothetical protein
MASTSRLLCSIAVLLALAACDRRDPTAPLAPAGPRRALDFDTAQLTLAGYEMVKVFNVPVKIDDASVPWTSTGVTLAAGEYAYLIPEGSVTFSLNEIGWSNCAKDPYWYCTKISGSAGPYGGVGGPSGGHDGHLRLFYRVNGAGTPSQILAQTAVAQGPGTIEVSRAGSDKYWDFSGAQTVQIWRLRGAQPPPPPQQEPRLQLACTPNPVTRGDVIHCTASKDSASLPAELTEIRWEFSGGDFKYPDDAAGDPVPSGSTWGGEMAMSGTVTVRAKLGGRDQSASTTVNVAPRTEFKKKRVSVHISQGTLADVPLDLGRPNDPPKSVSDLGRALTYPRISGYDPRTDLAEVQRTVALIQDEGPNHGLAYLKEVPMNPTAVVVIHPALARGSTFYRRQAQTSNVVHGTPPCVQSRWDEYVRMVEDHEGLRGNTNSHVGALEAAINPAAAEAVEHIVRRTDQLAEMADEWWELLKPVADRALEQASNEVFHSTPGGRVRFGCEFNFEAQGR